VSQVSGTNAVSDGNETNDPTPVSQVSGTNAVSDGNETNDPTPVSHGNEPHEPHIKVLKGKPTDEEVAALIAVLGSAAGGGAEVDQPEISRWGLPVDKLRYSIFSWQKLTLVQRTHMRR
jgi:hypothetical protein